MSVVASLSAAEDWAQQQFGTVQLGDQRRTRRAVKVAAAMAADPAASIPQQNKLWKQTKGAYRLFDQQQVTYQAMIEPHWQQTRAAAAQGQVVLMVQDTTQLDFSAHVATAGLGPLGQGRALDGGQGMFLHSTLAVELLSTDGQAARVLGLAWSKLWSRDQEPVPGGETHRQRRARPRESQRWTEAVERIGAPPPGGGLWVHVGDRESDIFELYERCRRMPGVSFVIRSSQPRGASVGHVRDSMQARVKTRLLEVARAMPASGSKRLWVPPRGGRAAGRWAELSVSGGAVTLWSPWHQSRTPRPLHCWAVRVWEQDAPAGVEPIEWVLLTAERVATSADALRVAGWYALRWTVEEYHKCLKSGCRVEQRQLESASRLRPLIAMLSVVAVRLLQLKNDARIDPDRPAHTCVAIESVRALAALLDQRPQDLTLRRFTHEVAKLGGFLGRKSDRDPGWQTLWRGWRELDLITLGFHLASAPTRCG